MYEDECKVTLSNPLNGTSSYSSTIFSGDASTVFDEPILNIERSMAKM